MTDPRFDTGDVSKDQVPVNTQGRNGLDGSRDRGRYDLNYYDGLLPKENLGRADMSLGQDGAPVGPGGSARNNEFLTAAPWDVCCGDVSVGVNHW